MMSFYVHHILVKHQYEAEDLLKKLNDGAAFEVLAMKYSICSSAPQGGDLGPLKSGQTVEEFEQASLGLKPGETSRKPVRTQFGYHLIKRIR
jgi:peptidyl-prolyl cis-trans isomerase C